MKKTTITIVGIVMLFVIACKEKPNSTTSSETSNALEQKSNLTSLQIVNKRMALLNEHNFQEFTKLYHKDVETYTYPKRIMGTGSDRLASIYKSDFDKKSISVKIVNQITNGPYVINHEIVTNKGKEKKYVSIYKVEDGLITRVSFVREFSF